MTPFFLRRLKSEVLTDLPEKIEELKRVPMAQQQEQLYSRFIEDYKKRAKEVSTTK
jgi:SNF2 family DNA or RNA helicase